MAKAVPVLLFVLALVFHLYAGSRTLHNIIHTHLFIPHIN